MMQAINKHNMIKNGSIAALTMFIVSILFGRKNIVFGFPIALSAIVLDRRNAYLKPINKLIRILVIDLIIVFIAFLSGINIYTAIIINFLAVFFIIYILYTPNDINFFEPFIMLYVFCNYPRITIEELPYKFLSVTVGIGVVFICNCIFKFVNEKKKLKGDIKYYLNNLDFQLNNILEKNYNEKINKDITNKSRELSYSVYVSRHKAFFTTKIGKIQFELLLSIEYLNIYLEKINKLYLDNEISESLILDLSKIINNIKLNLEGEVNKKQLENLINLFNEKYNESCTQEIVQALKVIIKNMESLKSLNSKESNCVYKDWKVSDINKNYVFNKNDLRFKFALRMAITVSLVIFIISLLGYFRIIWLIVSVISSSQPYYEDTIRKGKFRIIGNISGISLAVVFLSSISNEFILIILFIVFMYLVYAYREYYRVSFFATIPSLMISESITNVNINHLAYYRAMYILLGVSLAFIASRFILSYKLKDGVKELSSKIEIYNKELSLFLKNKDKDKDKLRDIIISSSMISQQLKIRNDIYKDESVDKVLEDNNKFLIKYGFNILLNNKFEYNIDLENKINYV